MANSEKKAATQHSKVKGYRWSMEWVYLVLEDGETVILDKKDYATIGLAKELKGEPIEYSIVEENVPSKYTDGTYNKVRIECIG